MLISNDLARALLCAGDMGLLVTMMFLLPGLWPCETEWLVYILLFLSIFPVVKWGGGGVLIHFTIDLFLHFSLYIVMHGGIQYLEGLSELIG